jgi:hypothetical protein
MKVLPVLSVLVCALLTAGVVHAEQGVSLGEVVFGCDPPFEDYMVLMEPSEFRIKVTNLVGNDCAYNPTFAWRVYSPTGVEWATTVLDTLGTLGLDQFDHVEFHSWGVTGSGVDTVGVTLYCDDISEKPGLYDGFDALAFVIKVDPDSCWIGQEICIDTVSVPSQVPGFVWAWEGRQGCNDIVADWDGPYCYKIAWYPDCTPPWFEDPPAVVEASHCATMTATFQVAEECHGPPLTYHVVSGPGTFVSKWPPVWAWDGAALSDVGQPLEVGVIVCDMPCHCSETHVATLVVTNEAPEFVGGCHETYVVEAGQEVQAVFEALDCCGEDPQVFFVADDAEAIGPYAVEGNVLTYTPDAADAGVRIWTIGVTDGVDTSACTVAFSDGSTCCGLYSGGYTGNTNCSTDGLVTLADITALIDRVYITKEELCCPESGNVNGSEDGLVTLGDITVLIDHVYISRVSTAFCQ